MYSYSQYPGLWILSISPKYILYRISAKLFNKAITDDFMKAENTILPKRATFGSAGYDFCSPYDVELIPGVWTDIDTGVRLDNEDCCVDYNNEVIRRWFMLIVPRSGLSNRYGFRIRNTVGIIDMDYRDNIKAKVTVDVPYTLKKGERFMQGIVLPFGCFVHEIPPTNERVGGFGSTGKI